MLNVFTLVNGRLVQEEIDSADALAHARPAGLHNPRQSCRRAGRHALVTGPTTGVRWLRVDLRLDAGPAHLPGSGQPRCLRPTSLERTL